MSTMDSPLELLTLQQLEEIEQNLAGSSECCLTKDEMWFRSDVNEPSELIKELWGTKTLDFIKSEPCDIAEEDDYLELPIEKLLDDGLVEELDLMPACHPEPETVIYKLEPEPVNPDVAPEPEPNSTTFKPESMPVCPQPETMQVNPIIINTVGANDPNEIKQLNYAVHPMILTKRKARGSPCKKSKAHQKRHLYEMQQEECSRDQWVRIQRAKNTKRFHDKKKIQVQLASRLADFILRDSETTKKLQRYDSSLLNEIIDTYPTLIKRC